MKPVGPYAGLGRRSLLLAALVALPAQGAFAADQPEGGGGDKVADVGLFCDPTLGSAMRQAGMLFEKQAGAPVSVLSAPPSLMLAQLAHDARADLLITLAGSMDEAGRRGLVKPETRREGWRNRLVLAARAGEVSSVPAVDPDSLARLLGGGRLAITDPTVAAAFGGAAVLDRLGLTAAVAGKFVGAANSADVAFLVKTGAARLGLLYMTDVRAESALAVVATLDAAAAPTAYAGALNRKSESPNAQRFLDFLLTSDAAVLLRAQGLEVTT